MATTKCATARLHARITVGSAVGWKRGESSSAACRRAAPSRGTAGSGDVHPRSVARSARHEFRSPGIRPLDPMPTAAGVPARLAEPETVCHCLEQAVRGGPKRTGARTLAQNRAAWERHGFSRWPCRRLGVPASVAPTPAGPVRRAHGCPRGSDIRRLVRPWFIVRRHGLQPAVSDYGCPRVKQGQPCGRRGNLPEGRSDRILCRRERSSNRPPPACPAGAEVLVARRTAFPRDVRPRSVLWSAAIHCRFGTAREHAAPAHLSPLSAFSTSAKAAMNRRTPKAPARAPLLGWAGPETVCLERAVRGGPKRTGARTFAQIRAVWERPRFSRRPCRRLGAPASSAPTPAGPVCHAHDCPRGSDIRWLVCPCFVGQAGWGNCTHAVSTWLSLECPLTAGQLTRVSSWSAVACYRFGLGRSPKAAKTGGCGARPVRRGQSGGKPPHSKMPPH